MKARPARLYVFDVLAIAGRDYRGLTLRDRRVALQELLTTAPPEIVLSEQWDDGPALFKSVIDHKLEGVVGKKLESLYLAGRSNDLDIVLHTEHSRNLVGLDVSHVLVGLAIHHA